MKSTYLLPWLESIDYATLKKVYPNIPAEERMTDEDYKEIYDNWCNSSTAWREHNYTRYR